MNNIIFLAKVEVETFLPEGRMSKIRFLLEPCVVINPEEIIDQVGNFSFSDREWFVGNELGRFY